MQIIVKDAVKNFVTTLILRLRRVPHLRVANEVAKKSKEGPGLISEGLNEVC